MPWPGERERSARTSNRNDSILIIIFNELILSDLYAMASGGAMLNWRWVN
jgi:hypothetical protein